MAIILLFTSCKDETKTSDSKTPATTKTSLDSVAKKPTEIADPATIIARKQVPILCYHQISRKQEKLSNDRVLEAMFRYQ